MLAPGLELMVPQDAADRLERNARDDGLMFRLPCQREAVPLGEETTELIGALACHFDQMHRHLREKTPAGDRDATARPTHAPVVGGTGSPSTAR